MRQGFIKDGLKTFKMAIDKSREFYFEDFDLAVLLGDYGELLLENKCHTQAQEAFLESKRIFGKLLSEFNYNRNPPNFNERIKKDRLSVFESFQWTEEDKATIMEGGDVKGDKKGGKKKEEKKGKKDAKGQKKGGAGEGPSDAVPLDIEPLNPV